MWMRNSPHIIENNYCDAIGLTALSVLDPHVAVCTPMHYHTLHHNVQPMYMGMGFETL